MRGMRGAVVGLVAAVLAQEPTAERRVAQANGGSCTDPAAESLSFFIYQVYLCVGEQTFLKCLNGMFVASLCSKHLTSPTCSLARV